MCLPCSINPSPEIVEHEIPKTSPRKEKNENVVVTKKSNRETIAFVLALLFVVAAGSGFAWGIADLMRLLNRALPALMQSQVQLWAWL